MTEIITGPQLSLLEILLVLGAVLLVPARWFPARVRRWCASGSRPRGMRPVVRER